jgi:hypothetical protein
VVKRLVNERIVGLRGFAERVERETHSKEGVCLNASQVDYLFITDVLTLNGAPFGQPRPWGKVVIQIPSRSGVGVELISAQAKLVAIHAAARKWPGIIRLRDSDKLTLENCDWDVGSLGEPSYEDSLGRAWIIDPGRGIP